MINQEQMLLVILAEECDEVAKECAELSQRALKAIRFGMKEMQPGDNIANASRIVKEFNDLYAIMELLHEQGVIEQIIVPEYVAEKREKVAKYNGYSKQLGILMEEK